MRQRIRRLAYLPLDAWQSLRGDRSRLVPPRGISDVGGGDFEEIGEKFLGYFKDFGGLTPQSRVLDAGCGVGRMAVPLTRYLDPEHGSYEGFDIVPREIDWCRKNITPRFPNFRFRLADIYNREYNASGRVSASEYRFPYKEGTFDFVILTSVFTHLLPAETENYISEIGRVLVSGGTCLCTFFLLNEESLGKVETGQSRIPLPHDHGYYRVKEKAVPEAAIAYDEGFVRDTLRRNGLSLAGPVRYGAWCGREKSTSFQDIVVMVKK